MELEAPSYVAGRALTTPAGVNSANTDLQISANEGKVIGLSISRNYTDQVLGSVLLSIKSGSKDLFLDMPASQLIPHEGRLYFPLKNKIDEGTTLKVTVNSLSATPAANNPIYLITHHQ